MSVDTFGDRPTLTHGNRAGRAVRARAEQLRPDRVRVLASSDFDALRRQSGDAAGRVLSPVMNGPELLDPGARALWQSRAMVAAMLAYQRNAHGAMPSHAAEVFGPAVRDTVVAAVSIAELSTGKRAEWWAPVPVGEPTLVGGDDDAAG